MAPSPFSDTKMKNLLVGVILGLLVVVHSTSVKTIHLTEAENDIFQEAVKDEFLILSVTTQLPKRSTTIQSSSDPKQSDISESSLAGHSDNHTQSVTHAQSSASPVVTQDMDDSRSHPPTTQSHSSAEKAVMEKTFLNHLGSGDGEVQGQYPARTLRAEGSALLPTSTALLMFTGSEGSGSELGISEESTNLNPVEEAIMQKTFLNHEHSILTSDAGSADGEMQGQYSATTFRAEVRTTLPTSTPSPMFTGSERTVSGLGISEESTNLNPVEEAIMQKTFLNHEHSILTSDSGSADEELQDQYSATTFGAEASTALPTSTPSPMFTGSEDSDSRSENRGKLSAEKQSIILKNENRPGDRASPQNTGGSTPSWIIILAFVVGVAALVIVSVAIATRKKWIGPNQVSQLEAQTNSSNQQGELEMKTLLNQDKPKENGKAADYTIVPLDELPQSYTSH